MRMHMLVRIAVGAMLAMQLSAAAAQAREDRFARIVVIQPRAGQAEAFAAGYRQHLQWHRAQRDPWTWYGWTFVLGERIGQFMDGTFGHAAGDFDHAVDPAGDAADNAANVSPHAEFLGHGVYERLDAVSSGKLLPDTSPYMLLQTFIVPPGREAAFEAALAGAQRQAPRERRSWYRLRIGGPSTQYLLMRAAQSFAEASTPAPILVPADLGVQAHSELLRYQPQMSHVP